MNEKSKVCVQFKSLRNSQASIIRYGTLNPSVQRSQQLTPIRKRTPHRMLPEDIQSHKYQRLMNVIDQRAKMVSIITSPNRHASTQMKRVSVRSSEQQTSTNKNETVKKKHKLKTQENSSGYELKHISETLSNNQIHLKFPQLQGMKEALHVQEKKASISYLLDAPRKHKPLWKINPRQSEKKMKFQQPFGQADDPIARKSENPATKKEKKRESESRLTGWTMHKWQF